MRSILMTNAPDSRRWSWSGPVVREPGCSSGSGCRVSNVCRARFLAAKCMTSNASFDFCEESSGDAGSMVVLATEGDGDAFDDTCLKRCQIGNDRVKSLIAEMLAQLVQVRLLDRARPLEP